MKIKHKSQKTNKSNIIQAAKMVQKVRVLPDEPRFNSQYPHSGSQLSVTLAVGEYNAFF